MTTRSLVRIALFAAIIAALGLLPKFDLPFAGGVPITAQSLGVMLAGVLLGPRQGAAAVLLVIFVVALGAPILAGGRGGLGVFVGPTVGFLVGWLPGAFVAGLVFQALPQRLPVGVSAALAAFVGGVLVIYAFGIAGLSMISGMSLAQAAMASLVFLPGDIVKAIATGVVTAATPAPIRVSRAVSST
ncbi:biotin transporter BioY [Microvirga pakistanensis]|uniref:biotin transporter BioY n=1 Tax=Microvirga pakistanensis TaxID=1682650 RepID=UPI001069264F|nr:biotin transporter BioY [Microvirga pakistanensis]